MKSLVRCAAILLAVLSCASAQAQSLVLYDDFSGSRIDPDKWLTSQEGAHVMELVRRIEAGQLRLLTRVYGETTSDAGTTFPGLSMRFPDPNPITAIQSTVTVTHVAVAACDTNPAFTAAQEIIFGHFFNADAPIPGSSVGDVFAAIYLTQTPSDPANQLQARFQVFECLDFACANNLSFDFGNLGPVTTGQPVTLLLQWDQPNHQFIFQRDTNDPVFSSYAVPDVATPGFPIKEFGVGGAVANCTATPRPRAFINTLLGSVFVNQ